MQFAIKCFRFGDSNFFPWFLSFASRVRWGSRMSRFCPSAGQASPYHRRCCRDWTGHHLHTTHLSIRRCQKLPLKFTPIDWIVCTTQAKCRTWACSPRQELDTQKHPQAGGGRSPKWVRMCLLPALCPCLPPVGTGQPWPHAHLQFAMRWLPWAWLRPVARWLQGITQSLAGKQVTGKEIGAAWWGWTGGTGGWWQGQQWGTPGSCQNSLCLLHSPLPPPFPSAPVFSLLCQPQTSHFIHPPDM